jgi:hypothetical protein
MRKYNTSLAEMQTGKPLMLHRARAKSDPPFIHLSGVNTKICRVRAKKNGGRAAFFSPMMKDER